MVMLHSDYVYNFLFLNYDLCYKVLQGLGLVMLATFIFLHYEIDEGLSQNVEFVHEYEYVVLSLCSFLYEYVVSPLCSLMWLVALRH